MWPGAVTADEALEKALAAWAQEHDLVEASARPTNDVLRGEISLKLSAELVRLSRIPAPPNGQVTGVSLYGCRPMVGVSAKCGHLSTHRSYQLKE